MIKPKEGDLVSVWDLGSFSPLRRDIMKRGQKKRLAELLEYWYEYCREHRAEEQRENARKVMWDLLKYGDGF